MNNFYKMKAFTRVFWIYLFIVSISLTGCNAPSASNESQAIENEFIVESPKVSYPLPVVDYVGNNGDKIKKRSINDNPVAYILRGINDIWKGTTEAYQSASSQNGPGKDDYKKGKPIIDSVIWSENIQYVIDVTQNRTNEEAILAYLDENRAKYYSVIDGFGPLTEDYVKYSGAYVDLSEIKCNQVLEDIHYHCDYNDHSKFAGDENSPLGAVVRLARDFRDNNSSSNGVKYLYSTPRPWRMNDTGGVNFLGTTYDTVTQKPTYNCIDSEGDEILKIFDVYESSVNIIPGLVCSRKNHKNIYVDNNPSPNDLYNNTTENRRTDNAYPSGHTNAGFLSALAYAYAFPERFQEMVFRGAMLGENRIVAGMHSPVDVIGGKTMALSLACSALNQSTVSKNAEEAVESIYHFFEAKADSQNMSLYDYAHRKVESPKGYTNGEYVNVHVFNNNFYDDKMQIKQRYHEWLTYGFTQDSTKANLKPIVPKGAETILKSRFPYLSDNQRRAVLYTTEIPSGYKILDKTNGWGRIDLLAASDGYGSFIGHVNVNMDASLGRFNASDTWGNNIDGDGYLTKRGTGKLILTGNNKYSGGTTITEGILATNSATGLGHGDVVIEEKGQLEVNHPLTVKGNLTLNSGTIQVNINSVNTTQMVVEGDVKLHNSTLLIHFNSDIIPEPQDTFAIIQCSEISGNIKNLEAKGYKLSQEVVDNVLFVIVE
ncbi:MAG: phosphatase PAP2 family protein [Prolixibacteraceae bacterium]|jgi:autotransporter-associated beta strand protein|nr:phosphatase PAP2 family protein [Prolixibacteraceae bacterium]